MYNKHRYSDGPCAPLCEIVHAYSASARHKRNTGVGNGNGKVVTGTEDCISPDCIRWRFLGPYHCIVRNETADGLQGRDQQ